MNLRVEAEAVAGEPTNELDPLVQRCRRGDALAWEALVRKFQSRIFGFAYHYVRDREEARDLAQEVFVSVYRSLPSYRGECAFLPWLMSIARNCCVDRLRRIKARPQSTGSISHESLNVPDNRVRPDERFELDRRRQLLYRALDTLTARSREMIILKDIHGLKLTEIAKMLSVPVGTVKSRTGRARVELARAITAIDSSYGAQS